MTEITIVAVPSEDDYVWRLSSEKVPHMTLLFLGEVPDSDLNEIASFVSHTCKTSLSPFGLSVDHRGPLGPDNADVLFFEKDRWNINDVSEFRNFLLKNNTIRKAFDSTEQYPEWTPHLTMGYPATPAKEDNREYPNTTYIHFNQIQVWTGDYEGPSFRLEYKANEPQEVSMADLADEYLAHFGVKGMRWGVTRTNPGGVEVSTTATPGKKVVAKGGQGQPAHEDAIRTAASKQKAKASTTDALSTKDLQELVNRMNLEQQYSKLTQEKNFFQKLESDKKNVDKLMGTAKTAENVYNFANSPFGKMLRGAVKAKLK